jgi:hypothetical protein
LRTHHCSGGGQARGAILNRRFSVTGVPHLAHQVGSNPLAQTCRSGALDDHTPTPA